MRITLPSDFKQINTLRLCTVAVYLEIPVGLQRKWLTDVNAFSGYLGHLELVDTVLVTVIANLQDRTRCCCSCPATKNASS